MKEIEDINNEINKGSTGIFKDKYEAIFHLVNGKIHRDNNLPAIEHINGDKWYYLNGKPHRLNGPAVEYSDGTIRYFYYGIKAINKKQFYDPSWRKKIEMKVFL